MANQASGTVSVLLGDGHGGFSPKTDFATGSGPDFVAAADFNADGNIDLAVVNNSSNTVSVLLGDGHGGFGAKADFVTGSSPYSVGTADLNGDGKTSFADYLLLQSNFGKSISIPAPLPAPTLVAAALAVPVAKAAKVATAQADTVRSIQAQTMDLIGRSARAIRPAMSSRLLRPVDSALARSLLALDRLI